MRKVDEPQARKGRRGSSTDGQRRRGQPRDGDGSPQQASQQSHNAIAWTGTFGD